MIALPRNDRIHCTFFRQASQTISAGDGNSLFDISSM